MNSEYILPVPILNYQQSIKDLLHYLMRSNTNARYIILTDVKERPCGLIHMDKLYKKIAFGLQLEGTLESLGDKDYIAVSKSYSFVNPDLLVSTKIIVTDDSGKCLGIADNKALLADFVRLDKAEIGNVTDNIWDMIDFGIMTADIYGTFISMNRAARKILHKSGIMGVCKIEDLISKFHYSDLRKRYEVQFPTFVAEIESYPFYQAGEEVRILLVLSDYSEVVKNRKQAAVLKDRNKELMEILEHSYDEIYVTDEKGVCVFVNESCERIYGLRREDMIGKTSAQMKLDGFVSSDLSEKVIESEHRLMEIQTTKIGQKMLVIASPIFDRNGKVKRVVINSRELTDLIDVRVSVDNLKQTLHSNIVDKIMELSLESNKVVAESEKMKRVVKSAASISQMEVPVVIEGETGTGKDVMATLIHETSSRHNQRFVKFNCMAVSGQSAERELFGYEERLPDGKRVYRKGLFLLADKSTILLDGIDCLPFETQGKILYAIESKSFLTADGRITVRSDFRIIATICHSQKEEAKDGRVREDLYYRLGAAKVCLPPLRERREDIPFLIRGFLSEAGDSFGYKKKITPGAIEKLKEYQWRGNVRELRNIVRRLYALTDSSIITDKELELLPEFINTSGNDVKDYKDRIGKTGFSEIMDEFEKELLKEYIRQCDNTYNLAELLDISQATAVRKMQKYKLKFHK